MNKILNLLIIFIKKILFFIKIKIFTNIVIKNTVIIPIEEFEHYFKKYFPKKKYDYYYNNLYNELVLNEDYKKRINSYIDTAREYISTNDFTESFEIIKSIIEAYHDSNKLNVDTYVFEVISKIGMLLRISYRKANSKTKKIISEWVKQLEQSSYYNNYYLEDLIVTLYNNK